MAASWLTAAVAITADETEGVAAEGGLAGEVIADELEAWVTENGFVMSDAVSEVENVATVVHGIIIITYNISGQLCCLRGSCHHGLFALNVASQSTMVVVIAAISAAKGTVIANIIAFMAAFVVDAIIKDDIDASRCSLMDAVVTGVDIFVIIVTAATKCEPVVAVVS